MLLLLGLLGGAGCRDDAEVRIPSGAVAGTSHIQPLFDDRTSACGIDFTYRNSEELERNSLVESVGGGVALVDLDNDGRLDIVATGGGTFAANDEVRGFPTGIFRQKQMEFFDDVSVVSGASVPPSYSHGIAVSDYDNDGFRDFLVTGYGGVTLWRNLGDGTFLDSTTTAEIVDNSWSTSAGWGDVTGDGLPDLYVTHYADWSWENHPVCKGANGVADICPLRDFGGLTDELYVNVGAETFRSDSEQLRPEGKGLGVLLVDIDVDSDLDIYVANDTTENFLYLNGGHGQFSEEGLQLGVAVDDKAHPTGSMGVAVADYNQDLLPDIWVANYEAEAFALYRNAGNSGFVYATAESGVGRIGDLYVGFGCAFSDLDGDGDEDLIVSNGHVVQTPRQSPIRQRPLILVNDTGQFRQCRYDSGYFAKAHIGRGLAKGDIDNDGDEDLVISHNNSPISILENTTSIPGERLTVRLIGVTVGRDSVGALIRLRTNRRTLQKQITGGGSYLSHSDLTIIFRFESGERPEILDVTWPGGKTATMPAPQPATTFLTIIEGRSEAIPTGKL